MQMRKQWALAWLVLLASSQAYAACDEESTRELFRQKKYDEVIAACAANGTAAAGATVLYRLAISHQKMGNGNEAGLALGLALEQNPRGTFASSPARLEQLKSDIALLPRKPVIPDVEKAETSPIQQQESNKSSSAAVTPAVVVSATVPDTIVLTKITKESAVPVQERNMDVGYLGAAALGGMLLSCLGYWLVQRFMRRKNEQVPMRGVVRNLLRLKQESSRLRRTMEKAGKTDSVLYFYLDKLSESLDLEIGRSTELVARKKIPEGASIVQGVDAFEKAPLKISTASIQEIEKAFSYTTGLSQKKEHRMSFVSNEGAMG